MYINSSMVFYIVVYMWIVDYYIVVYYHCYVILYIINEQRQECQIQRTKSLHNAHVVISVHLIFVLHSKVFIY